MTSPIRKVAVLGSGVMGSGIAAHLASCGIRTLLLDIVPPDLDQAAESSARNAFAAKGLEAALKSRPNVFVEKASASLIQIGNLTDDLDQIASCDWVIEVVKEDMAIKRDLQRRLQPAGFNVGFNAGAAAGQTVMHVHVHLIPRFKGDMADPRGGVRGVIPSKQRY